MLEGQAEHRQIVVMSEITRMLHGWKRMSSFRIRRWYADHAPNYFAEFGAGDRFWQPKSYTFHICTERKLQETLDYIHLNPVRAGLVAKYLRRQSVGVLITWIECG